MNNIEDIKQSLRELFHSQYFMVLATTGDSRPHTSLVSFATTHDLEWFYFATPRSTQKFANISNDCRVSLLIDNRGNEIKDIATAMAVTVDGIAEEIANSERESRIELYLEKNPAMREFLQSPNTVFVKVKALRYRVVTQFQNVVTLDIKTSP